MLAPTFTPPPDAPPAIVRELRHWHAADQACRADPTASTSCDARTGDVAILYRKGWCYGDPKKIETEAVWARCESVTHATSERLPPGDRLNYDPDLAAARQQREIGRQMRENIETGIISAAHACVEVRVGDFLAQRVKSRRSIAEQTADACTAIYSRSYSFAGKLARPAALVRAYDEINRQASAGQR